MRDQLGWVEEVDSAYIVQLTSIYGTLRRS
jgi:hypothetical protein